jgi:hypothetical protein
MASHAIAHFSTGMGVVRLPIFAAKPFVLQGLPKSVNQIQLYEKEKEKGAHYIILAR